MEERMIKPVSNKMDKYQTYRKNIGRYKKAMQHQFYFEAMLIDYAMLEDRLSSFLYHMGALANRSSSKVGSKRTKEQLKQIVLENKLEDENDTMGVKNISSKMKVIRAVLLWAANSEGVPNNDRYLTVLKKQLIGEVDIGGMLDVLDEIKLWCKYRNEIIHALMNKNVNSVDEQLEEQAQKGMELAKFLSAQVNLLKKGNKVRKSANLSIDK